MIRVRWVRELGGEGRDFNGGEGMRDILKRKFCLGNDVFNTLKIST